MPFIADIYTLAAIVSKETTETAWNGSGVGIGLTTAGISPMLGFADGSSYSQTKRARDFAEPVKENANLLETFKTPLMILGVACAFNFLPYMMNLVVGSPAPDDRYTNALMTFLQSSGTVLAVVGFGVATYICISGKAEVGEDEREKAYALKEQIYNRLRYIEADHVIFDPVSNQEAPANKAGLAMLLQQDR